MKPTISLAAAVVTFLGLTTSVHAGDCPKFTGTQVEENFGSGVAMDGNTAVIAAEGHNGDTGAVFVFEYDSTAWQPSQTLMAGDGDAGDEFGHSPRISGDVMIVGAPFDSDIAHHAGAAYIFRRNAGVWMQEQKLTPAGVLASDRFGRDVTIEGDVAVIGSRDSDDAGSLSGSAYVFRFDGTNWVEQQKLTASDAAAGARFGDAVAIQGDTIVIGAFSDAELGMEAGAAYVFRYDGSSWVEVQKLTASDGEPLDRFGRSISISGDVMMIGAQRGDEGGTVDDDGAVYVFDWNGAEWTQSQQLTVSASSSGEGNGFYNVALDGDTAVVGARQIDRVFRYDLNGGSWTRVTRYTGSTDDFFGDAVALDGDTALVGAQRDDDAATDAGAGYFFSPSTITVNPGESIQAAIDAACDGDEIVLQPGTYTQTIDFKGKAITVRSTDPTDPDVVAATVIDGGTNAVPVVFKNSEGLSATLDGITITGEAGYSLPPGNGTPGVSSCDFLAKNCFGVPPLGDPISDGSYFWPFGGEVYHCFTPQFSGNVLVTVDLCESTSIPSATFFVDCSDPFGIPLVISPIESELCPDGVNVKETYALKGGDHYVLHIVVEVLGTLWVRLQTTRAAGGGIYIDGSSPTIRRCVIKECAVAMDPGGGVFVGEGGSPLFDRCRFEDNVAGQGGAVFIQDDSEASFLDCAFRGNVADDGGAIFNQEAGLTAMRCMFAGNSATENGGAIFNSAGATTITDSGFVGNDANLGGALYNRNAAVPTLSGCTIMANSASSSGPAFRNESGCGVVVANSIIWGHSGTPISEEDVNQTDIIFSDVQGGYSGLGNISVVPDVADVVGTDGIPGTDDDEIHLLPGSPCIDSGYNGLVAPDQIQDITGKPRIIGGTVDMGASEAAFEESDDLDEKETILLQPLLGVDRARFPVAKIHNLTGGSNATASAFLASYAVHPGAGGLATLGSTLIVQTSLPTGTFWLQPTMPFTQADLDDAGVTSPFDLDLVEYDASPDAWVLAGELNADPLGVRHEVTDTTSPAPPPPGSFGTYGDYGVFWNPDLGKGYVWANLDHVGDFAVGYQPCPADLANADAIIDVFDLFVLLNGWGSDGSGAGLAEPNDVVDVFDLFILLGAWGACD